jgi:hypothetical protein
MITVTVLHVTSDLAMLLIPVPMIAAAHLPLKRKIVLCTVFSLGVVVVIIAILNRYFNFTIDNSLVFLIWYNTEGSAAVMIANLPFCWTLLRKIFSLGTWSGTTKLGTANVQQPGVIMGQSEKTSGSRGRPSIFADIDLDEDDLENAWPRQMHTSSAKLPTRSHGKGSLDGKSYYGEIERDIGESTRQDSHHTHDEDSGCNMGSTS